MAIVFGDQLVQDGSLLRQQANAVVRDSHLLGSVHVDPDQLTLGGAGEGDGKHLMALWRVHLEFTDLLSTGVFEIHAGEGADEVEDLGAAVRIE